MLSKKFLVKLLIPVASFSLLSSQSLLWAAPSENNIIPATSSRIHYTGRSYQTGENVISICWPGTSLETKFEGTSVGLYLENVPNAYPDANYINVFIDGEELKPIRCDKDKNYILLKEGLKDTVHTLQIFKRTDSNAGPINFKGIALDEGKQLIDPQIKNDGLKIEFYGDSILSGSAVEAPTYLEYTDQQLKNMNIEREPFSQFDTWNNYIAFPAITARNLNADYSCITQGGIGLTNSAMGEFMNMKMFWNIASGPKDWTIQNPGTSYPFDFSKSRPADYVVIALGGNDVEYGIKGDFETEYMNFVQNIRNVYPNAKIFCVTTPPTSVNDNPIITEPIKAVVNEFNHKGDKNVFYYRFHEYTPYSVYVHPRVKEQAELGAELTKVIKENISSDLEVKYDVTGEFDTGSNINFTITNHNSFPITNWQVAFTLDEAESIAKLWNGAFKTTDKVVTVTNKDFNATIPAGGTINFGATINHNGELNLKDLKCNMQ